MSSVYQLIPELAALLRVFNELGRDSVRRMQSAMKEYGQLTDGQTSYMRLQAHAIAVSSVLGGVAGIASAFYPKGAAQPSLPSADLRSAANAGLNDLLSRIGEKLSDNEFMQGTLKSCAKAIPSIGQAGQLYCKGPETQLETARSLLDRVRFGEIQDLGQGADGANRQTLQMWQKILEARRQG